MKTFRSSSRAGAFTLIEMLVVIAIIGILAALLLPVLSQGRLKAQRVQCVSQLHQAGQAFHSFAHDHNDLFPMQVPASAGGSREAVQGAYQLVGEFYFAYRHFQALSNELVSSQLVLCPSDTRLPAANFVVLRNKNLSYFVGVNAEYAKPNSILAGDRNITNDWTAPATMQHLGPDSSLRWTEELHRFKGNLLFSDGRVEEKNSPGLRLANNESPSRADLALPSVRPALSAAPPATPDSLPSRVAAGVTPASLPGLEGTNPPTPAPASGIAPTSTRQNSAALPAEIADPSPASVKLENNPTNPPAASVARPSSEG